MAVVDGNAVVWCHDGTVVVAVFRVPGKKKKYSGLFLLPLRVVAIESVLVVVAAVIVFETCSSTTCSGWYD